MVRPVITEYKPDVIKTTTVCRECGKSIAIQLTDLTENEIKIFHSTCYTKFLLNYKEYGIRIGMRVHGKKKPKKHE